MGLKSENCFDHNSSRSARIELRFCTVAKLEKLNNFYLDCFESYITKNASFENPGYLARARARVRARPSCSTGASGPFDDRRLRSTTFRARATFKKSTSILSYSLSGVVLLFLCQFHIVLFKLCTDVL